MMRADTYGCTNWQPKWLLPGETEETQKRAQENLKNMQKKSRTPIVLKISIVTTFYTQRSNISRMDPCSG